MNGIASGWIIELIKPDGTLCYESLADCINDNSVYEVNIYKDGKQIETYSPVWSYTEFTNEYQRIGITDEKIIIRIKEM